MVAIVGLCADADDDGLVIWVCLVLRLKRWREYTAATVVSRMNAEKVAITVGTFWGVKSRGRPCAGLRRTKIPREKESEREREKEKEKEKEKDKENEKDREKEQEQEKNKGKGKERERERKRKFKR